MAIPEERYEELYNTVYVSGLRAGMTRKEAHKGALATVVDDAYGSGVAGSTNERRI